MKKLFNTLAIVAALLGASSCDDLLEMVMGGGDNLSLIITPKTVQIQAEGGEAVIAFTAPEAWSASADADWLSIEPSVGISGDAMVTITARPNPGAERSTTVTVESGNIKASALVQQAAGDGGEVTPSYDKWYICGNFTEYWTAEAAIAMEYEEDGCYSLELTVPELAEFKFILDKSWEVNLGTEDMGDPAVVGNNNSPAIVPNKPVKLKEGGYNLFFPNGGDIKVFLDTKDLTASIEGGNPNPPDGPSGELWSIIGTVNGSNWDQDFDMKWNGDNDAPVYFATIYYEDGQEFKFRKNHEWVEDFGFGPIIMPEPAILTLVGQGPNITLPWTGYWNLYLTPDSGELQFYPAEDFQWQYFTNPDGSVSEVTFSSSQLESAVTGKIKYYEVNGVRTCKTETGGAGVLGRGNNREWYFVWYTDSNLIKLPIQPSGFVDSQYGEALVLSPYYYYGVYYAASNPDLGTYFDFVNNYPSYPEAYYDGNGGFYFGIMWYLFADASVGYNPENYDVLAEGDGYDRKDCSMSISVGPAIDGARDITFKVGKDVASVRYVIVDEQIEDDGKAFDIAQHLVDGSINYNNLDQFAVYDSKTYFATVTYNAQVPGYHTVVAISLDAAGEWYYWYYYWFYLDPSSDSNTWTTLGTGMYTDDFIASIFQVDNLTWEVEVQQCDQDPTRIRMVYPYDGKYGYNDPGDWDDTKSYDIEIVIPDANHVYIKPQSTGVDWGYGMISIASMAGYLMDNGTSIDNIGAENFGVFADGEISFGARALLTYNDGAWYYANRHAAFKLVLQGAPTAAGAPKKVAAPSGKAIRNSHKALDSANAGGNGGKAVRPHVKLTRAE